MYDIILALYEKYMITGQGPLEWCLNFSTGTELYQTLEHYACGDGVYESLSTLSIQTRDQLENAIRVCDIEELMDCFYALWPGDCPQR